MPQKKRQCKSCGDPVYNEGLCEDCYGELKLGQIPPRMTDTRSCERSGRSDRQKQAMKKIRHNP